MKSKYVIGVDEAGRGSLAGPVVAAAVLIKRGARMRGAIKLKDSKRLSRLQREYWFSWIRFHGVPYAVSSISAGRIDKMNIARAANTAVTLAVKKLGNARAEALLAEALLDGGLRVNAAHLQKTIIRGDEKIKVIALASVIAKVTRDRKMARLHSRHPKYGFYNHKGYGTREHFRAISRHGPTPHHRLTYLRKHA